MLLVVCVHAANISDSAGISLLLPKMREKYPKIQVIFADSGYQKSAAEAVKTQTQAELRVVKRPQGKGFQVVAHRWKVERTFGWLSRNRQLSKDYDLKVEHSKGWIYLAMIRLMLARLTNLENHNFDNSMKN